jgi:protein-S-isoprenylcysteine O-methyltransferase Ste14
MIQIGNFFFKYRNLVFPIIGVLIFIPSPLLFTAQVFGDRYYIIPLVLGITIALIGQVIRALTIGLKYIVRGGKDKKVYAEDLVTDGIFGHCRNPLYVGNILMLLGVGIISNSLFFLLFVVPFFCFIYQAIVLAEENYLRNKFGVSYLAYTNNVNRWIPDLRGLGYTLSSMEFNWRRYLINEYNTIYMLLISILLVIFTHSPELIQLPRQQRWESFLYWFVAITIVYLFVRYLKKSKKLTATTT